MNHSHAESAQNFFNNNPFSHLILSFSLLYSYSFFLISLSLVAKSSNIFCIFLSNPLFILSISSSKAYSQVPAAGFLLVLNSLLLFIQSQEAFNLVQSWLDWILLYESYWFSLAILLFRSVSSFLYRSSSSRKTYLGEVEVRGRDVSCFYGFFYYF